MQIRMPTCRSVQEAAIISETAALIVAKEAQFRVTDKQQTVLDVSLAERPSSRLQAELLMAWLQTQLRGLTGRGASSVNILPASKIWPSPSHPCPHRCSCQRTFIALGPRTHAVKPTGF